MVIQQRSWTGEQGWKIEKDAQFATAPQLVLVFGDRKRVQETACYAEIREFFPDPATHIVLVSSAGEIMGDAVHDHTLALTAIGFEKTEVKVISQPVASMADSEAAGKSLAAQLNAAGLVHVMAYSDGVGVNGSALIRGIKSSLPAEVSVTGGLAGDGPDFVETAIGLDEAATTGRLVLVGFYGENLKIGYGSIGGWDPFGPERVITKSKDNVLFELDGEPALPLYKKYLGELADELPGSGLHFPMRLRQPDPKGGADIELVRTLLSVNEAEQSITFAGDMPEGTPAMLMKANFERLIDGAVKAASLSAESLKAGEAELALLISCIGRKLVLKERTDEEIEGVRSVVGQQAVIAGFYSYGEICPITPTERSCELHNQTMTITTFREQ